MRYLTLHKTVSEYNTLDLDESNTPHVAYIIDENNCIFENKISYQETNISFKLNKDGKTELYYNSKQKLDDVIIGNKLLGYTIIDHQFDVNESIGYIKLDGIIDESDFEKLYPTVSVLMIK